MPKMGSSPTKNGKENVSPAAKTVYKGKQPSRKQHRVSNKDTVTETSKLVKRPQEASRVWEFGLESDGWWIQSLCQMDDCVLVWCTSTKRVSKLKPDGQVMKQIPLRPDIEHCDVEDVCLAPDDHKVWFCCGLDGVYEIDIKGQSQKIFRCNGRPLSLCVTRIGTVIVGMLGRLDIYSRRGETLYTAHLVVKKQNIETNHPDKVKECPKTRNVACLNDNFHSSTLIIMDDKLKLRWMFDGSSSISPDGKRSEVKFSSFNDFKSHDFSFSEDGNLFVADFIHCCVLELNQAGQFLRTFTESGKTNNLEMYSVCVCSDKTILVGYRHRQSDKRHHIVKKLKYK